MCQLLDDHDLQFDEEVDFALLCKNFKKKSVYLLNERHIQPSAPSPSYISVHRPFWRVTEQNWGANLIIFPAENYSTPKFAKSEQRWRVNRPTDHVIHKYTNFSDIKIKGPI